MKHKNLGFTIVELLIVIVVIAILASITVVAFNGIQTRATAAAISKDVKDMEKGFQLLGVERGWTEWPAENSSEFTGANNPQIADIIDQSNLSNYYQQVGTQSAAATSGINYDNDHTYDTGSYNGCDETNNNGVNIYFNDIDQAIAQAIDEQIDDGDLTCGDITFNSDDMRYNISPTYTNY